MLLSIHLTKHVINVLKYKCMPRKTVIITNALNSIKCCNKPNKSGDLILWWSKRSISAHLLRRAARFWFVWRNLMAEFCWHQSNIRFFNFKMQTRPVSETGTGCGITRRALSREHVQEAAPVTSRSRSFQIQLCCRDEFDPSDHWVRVC